MIARTASQALIASLRPLRVRPLAAQRTGKPYRLCPSSSRLLHTSQTLRNTPPPSRDPSHPHLYYHRLPDRISLSFLPHPPTSSRTVLGYIPDGAAGLNEFMENPAFVDLLHRSIREGLANGRAETVEFEAATRPGDGWIHITDERAVPPAGRIGETEDLIGTVFVENGKVVPSTYDPLPTYRLVTSNGPLILPRGLDQWFLEVLQKSDEDER